MNSLSDCLQPQSAILSNYVFGTNVTEQPKFDNGEPVEVCNYINNGLCHSYALVVSARLRELGVRHCVEGSPSHVWINYNGEQYDSRGVVESNWSDDPIDYENRTLLLGEFPHTYEGVDTLCTALLANGSPAALAWLAYCKLVLNEGK